MICKHCGTGIDNKTVLCAHCGKTAKRKAKIPTGLMIFLRICFLPITAIIAIAKSNKLSKKAKTILFVAVAAFLISVVIIGAVLGVKVEKADYEAIIASMENGRYEEAGNLINDFIMQYPDSEYLGEIKERQEKVDEEILKKEKEKTKKENARKANVTLDEFENMLAACKAIGIDCDKISNIASKDNWANGKRCGFSYSEYQFLVYFNQDGTVNSINSGIVKFYENGKKAEDVYNRLLTVDEKTQLKLWTEDNIKKILKSPSTAKFPGGFLTPFEDWSFSKNGTDYTVSSYVDSQNGFGATVRSKFTVTYEWKDGAGKVTSLIFDGKKII